MTGNTPIGDGKNRLNPIHGADMAQLCADAVASSETEVPAGRPVIYSQNEIAELAFSVLKKPQDHPDSGLDG